MKYTTTYIIVILQDIVIYTQIKLMYLNTLALITILQSEQNRSMLKLNTFKYVTDHRIISKK